MSGMASGVEMAIIIVSHNARVDVERCLESLHVAPPVTSHAILLVDNASADGTTSSVGERWPRVQVLANRENIGFGAANNRGIRESASDLVLLLNGDTIVPPGAIDRLAAELRADRGIGIVGPRLVDERGRPEISFGRMIGPFAELWQKTRGRAYAAGVPGMDWYVRRLTGRPRDVDWVSGACMLVRRPDLVAAGLFDERFELYCEDVDLCAAIRAAGRRVRFSPASEIVHLRGRSRASRPAQADDAYRRSQLAFYAKHHPEWVPLLKVYLSMRGKLPPGI
jgi:GT2 family glycosyltransferase